MTTPTSGSEAPALTKLNIPFVEFVVIIACLMALNALALDVMLPALPDIGADLNIEDPNKRQSILTAYLIGFGVAQLFLGPITDAMGRRGLLLAGLGLYSIGSIFAIFAPNLELLLAARVLQGIGCAAPRVIAVSAVRDCFHGRQMGRVMSLVMMIFMIVPIIAPSIGQAVLLFAGWHWIFSLLLFAGVAVLIWCAVRLPETLPKERRTKLEVKETINAYKLALTSRLSLGYMLALTFVFGGLFSFISMSQQIYVGIFDLGVWFPVVFALSAVMSSLSSFTNSRLVETIGMRRMSHGAVFAFVCCGSVMAIVSISGFETVYSFTIACALTMACFGFLGANFNALAMEPLGRIAGTASSVIGFVTTLGGALLGYVVGQMFNGTTLPLAVGIIIFGSCALCCILYAERGRLFHPSVNTD
ncbi:MAG: multidrug effflux MFS transporter [Rhodobacteraceae bacterium]|nr:multidrug effflux MFS transporter [Paracoccaceae bacterium]